MAGYAPGLKYGGLNPSGHTKSAPMTKTEVPQTTDWPHYDKTVLHLGIGCFVNYVFVYCLVLFAVFCTYIFSVLLLYMK